MHIRSHGSLSSTLNSPPSTITSLPLTWQQRSMEARLQSHLRLAESSGPDATFNQNNDGGLKVFCPTDPVHQWFHVQIQEFDSVQKVSLLLYHGIPVYQSTQMLKSDDAIANTWATNGANKYHFTVQNGGEVVTLKTKVITAKITRTEGRRAIDSVQN